MSDFIVELTYRSVLCILSHFRVLFVILELPLQIKHYVYGVSIFSALYRVHFNCYKRLLIEYNLLVYLGILLLSTLMLYLMTILLPFFVNIMSQCSRVRGSAGLNTFAWVAVKSGQVGERSSHSFCKCEVALKFMALPVSFFRDFQ